MRAGLGTIQQTLTPEAASVLTHSIAEAARRNHGQTTPLHVAATLLASPSGLLRQACVRSHPHSSHPLQCRALELCFSVALDRIPSTNPTSSSAASAAASEPPISNALMAALKRAQAHQRRGCPEQQQQPLLAVKVELEQLLISILDDPSVSRVMREASFSSTAVKAAVEQTLTSSSTTATTTSSAAASPSPVPGSPASVFPSTAPLGLNLGLRGTSTAAGNLFMNPRLHPGGGATLSAGFVGGDQPRIEEVKRVMDILLRSKKRNPVLVGDSDPAAVMREVLKKIEDGTSPPPPLQTAKIISVSKDLAAAAAGDRSQIPEKIKEFASTIGSNISDEQGVVLDLGDLKWLVESPGGAPASGSGLMQTQPIVSEAGRTAVAEMGKLLKMFEGSGRLWLIGTATCTTYLRCQVYHPSMENDWDLEAVPIAPRSAPPNTMQRLGGNGILSSSIVTLSPMKNFTGFGNSLMSQRLPPKTSLCPSCMENYESELATLVAKEFEKSSSKEETNQTLPQWLQLAKLSNKSGTKSPTDQNKSKQQEQMWKQSTEDLQKRWRDTCSRLHPNFHMVPLSLDKPSAPTLMKPLNLGAPRAAPGAAVEPKLRLSQGFSTFESKSSQQKITLNTSSEHSCNPPGSPVKTDLVLGSTRLLNPSPEKINGDRTKDLTGCTRDEFSGLQQAKVAGFPDIDSFKRLYKGLADNVGWQQEAASVVASVVLQCKSGNGKRRTGVMKTDTWLLFIGPDKIGKSKMATVLSETVSGTGPTTVNFGGTLCTDGYDESNRSSRGRTSMDRIVDAVRRNPFSVILLEDVDQADALVQSNIRRAMERGRLPDSYGREVSLGSVIFILTASFVPEELKNSLDSVIQCEKRILHSASYGWKLELSASAKLTKRPADWLFNEQPTKARKNSGGISLDLNLAIGGDDEGGEGSWNSSDVTAEHENEKGRLAVNCSSSSFASELMEFVDSAIIFKPVDFTPLRRTVLESISTRFTNVMGSGWAIKVDEDALERIVGGIWIGSSLVDEWAERVLTPSLKQLKANSKADGNVIIVTLVLVKGDCERRSSNKDWLPATVAVTVDAA